MPNIYRKWELIVELIFTNPIYLFKFLSIESSLFLKKRGGRIKEYTLHLYRLFTRWYKRVAQNTLPYAEVLVERGYSIEDIENITKELFKEKDVITPKEEIATLMYLIKDEIIKEIRYKGLDRYGWDKKIEDVKIVWDKNSVRFEKYIPCSSKWEELIDLTFHNLQKD